MDGQGEEEVVEAAVESVEQEQESQDDEVVVDSAAVEAEEQRVNIWGEDVPQWLDDPLDRFEGLTAEQLRSIPEDLKPAFAALRKAGLSERQQLQSRESQLQKAVAGVQLERAELARARRELHEYLKPDQFQELTAPQLGEEPDPTSPEWIEHQVRKQFAELSNKLLGGLETQSRKAAEDQARLDAEALRTQRETEIRAFAKENPDFYGLMETIKVLQKEMPGRKAEEIYKFAKWQKQEQAEREAKANAAKKHFRREEQGDLDPFADADSAEDMLAVITANPELHDQIMAEYE